jgi:HlyD family secretion protein
MTSKRRRVVAAAVGVVVLAGVVAGSVMRDRRQRVLVQAGDVAQSDLTASVTASGEIKPKRFVDVGANVSGRIVKLEVKEGDRVRTGQVLARIDSARVEAVLEQSQAAVQAARADLRRAEADLEVTRLAYERSRSMHAERLISDQDFERADGELKMKNASVQAQRDRVSQLAAGLASNRDDLEKTTVIAPMDGVVTSLKKEEGEVVIGAQSFQPTVILTVGDLSVMEVEVLVDETDIDSLVLGQEAEVRVDAISDLKIKGHVTEIGSSAIPRGGSTGAATSSSTQAKDFKVTVTLDDPPATLRPGLNATADIVTGRKQHVLAVPIQAVVVREVGADGKLIEREEAKPGEPGDVQAAVRKKGEEKDGVFVIVDGKAQFRTVKTGLMGETDIEVVEGLKAGEKIVVGSYKTLRTLKNDSVVKLETRGGGGAS